MHCLQGLQECLSAQDKSSLLALLTAWSQLWSRLAMDNSRCCTSQLRWLNAAAVLSCPYCRSNTLVSSSCSRSVRKEAALTVGMISAQAGRQLATFVKLLLPAWWMLCFDPVKPVAEAARQALSGTFPGHKECDALLFCNDEVRAQWWKHSRSCVCP